MVKISSNRIMSAVKRGEYAGFCLACGKKAYQVEPDAREYECQSCGENKVYGAEELLMMGYGE